MMRAFSSSVWRVRDMPRTKPGGRDVRGFSNGGRSGDYDTFGHVTGIEMLDLGQSEFRIVAGFSEPAAHHRAGPADASPTVDRGACRMDSRME
jgi:hypothetical protein